MHLGRTELDNYIPICHRPRPANHKHLFGMFHYGPINCQNGQFSESKLMIKNTYTLKIYVFVVLLIIS